MLIAIGGNSGSGKSTSARMLDPKNTFYVQTIPKPLPFPGWKSMYPLIDNKTLIGNRYVLFSSEFHERTDKEEYANASSRLINLLEIIRKHKPEIKNIILDDTQYIMAYEYMARSKEKGYDKFSDMAYNFFNVIKKASSMSEDYNIIFLHHTEVDNGIIKLKTSGKMLDSAITMEGLFTMVLMTGVIKENGKLRYVFTTQNDGTTTAKSPMGMFETKEIDNDLLYVVDTIHDFENITQG